MEPSGRQEIARGKHDYESQEVDRWLIGEEVVGLYSVSRSKIYSQYWSSVNMLTLLSWTPHV